jgi:RNA polymerase sigma factor (sigma-70 family)
MTDFELLREYQDGSQAAFTTLVRRHIDLVHSAAMRQLRDAHLAEDVVQRVFLTLARKAGKLPPQTILAAWLYNATRYACLDATRQRARRNRHEQKAATMAQRSKEVGANPDRHGLWDAVEPVLDSAMSNLNRRDRQLLIMRFWEARSIDEMAASLGVSSDAAKKRVSRAVERLRAALLDHGVRVPLTALCLLLGQAITPAPTGLALKTAAAVLAGYGAAPGSVALVKGGIALMAWTKTKIVAVLIIGLMVVGGGAYAVRTSMAPRQVVMTIPQNATAGTIAPPHITDSVWRNRFDELYGLAPGQDLKRVAPPFVPERKTQFQVDNKDMARMMGDPDQMWMTYAYNGSVHWQSCTVGRPAIGDALESGVGLRPWEVEAAVDLWKIPFPGDIVTREGSTREQRLSALEPLLTPFFGHEVHFEKKTVTRNVIVLSGQYRPVPARNGRGFSPYETVEVGPKGPPGAGVVTSRSFEGFCGALELILRMRVVDRRTGKRPAIITYRNNNVTSAVAEDPEKLRWLLDDLSRQTSLGFRVEPQQLDVWQMRGSGPASSADARP